MDVVDTKGLYEKYKVTRVDKTDKPGGKHAGCEYFVLDITHDPFAKAALAAYANACHRTHPMLALDLRDKVRPGFKERRQLALNARQDKKKFPHNSA